MKRSKNIDLNLMRKVRSSVYESPRLKPLVLAIAALTLASCSSNEEEVIIVQSVEDCQDKTELNFEQCEAAYAKAMAEAQRTGPRYRSESECEAEFGARQCRRNESGSFMPFMAGFIVSNLLSNDRSYPYNPVFHYQNSRSSNDNRFMTSDGMVLGRPGRDSYKVSPSSLKSKPSVTRTVSRGGFGSKASAKSSWGGGKSRGWGG